MHLFDCSLCGTDIETEQSYFSYSAPLSNIRHALEHLLRLDTGRAPGPVGGRLSFPPLTLDPPCKPHLSRKAIFSLLDTALCPGGGDKLCRFRHALPYV